MTESQVAILFQNQGELMNTKNTETVLSVLIKKNVLPARVLDSFQRINIKHVPCQRITDSLDEIDTRVKHDLMQTTFITETANAHLIKMVIDYLMCHTPPGFKWLVRALRKTSQDNTADLLEMNSGKDMYVYLVGIRHIYHVTYVSCWYIYKVHKQFI